MPLNPLFCHNVLAHGIAADGNAYPLLVDADGGLTAGLGGFILHTTTSTTTYTAVADTNASREAKLREILAALTVDNAVIELFNQTASVTAASPLSASLPVGITGTKIVFGEGSALIYATPADAGDDRALFDSSPNRLVSNFGAVLDDSTDDFNAWLSAYYSCGWEGYYAGPLGCSTPTATDSLAIGTGAKTFNTQAGLQYAAADTFRAHENGNNGNFMAGTVTSYDSGTGALVANITSVGGSGTIADWFLGTGFPVVRGKIIIDGPMRVAQPIWICAGLQMEGTSLLSGVAYGGASGVSVASGYANAGTEKFIVDTRFSLGGAANTMHQCGVRSLVVSAASASNADVSGVRYAGAQLALFENNIIDIGGRRGAVLYGHATGLNWILGKSVAAAPGLTVQDVPGGAFIQQSVEHFNDDFNSFSTLGITNIAATSTTSNAVGTGAKTFTIATGLGYLADDYVRVTDDAAPTVNFMHARVTSYNGGSGSIVLDCIYSEGSGTKTAWTFVKGQPTPAILLTGCQGCVLISPQGETCSHFLQLHNSSRCEVHAPLCSPPAADATPSYGISITGTSASNAFFGACLTSFGFVYTARDYTIAAESFIAAQNFNQGGFQFNGLTEVRNKGAVLSTAFAVENGPGFEDFWVGSSGGAHGFGSIYSPQFRDAGTGEIYLSIQGASSAYYGIRLNHASTFQYTRAAASHTANIYEWQNSAGTALASIGPAGTMRVVPVAVGSLPSAATAGVGARHFVNDALAPTILTTVTAGGSAEVPVYSDGTNWLVG